MASIRKPMLLNPCCMPGGIRLIPRGKSRCGLGLFHDGHRHRHVVAQGDGFQRPATIKWDEGLVNNVNLIGYLGKDATLREYETEKVAYTSLKTPESWFTLNFSDVVAEVAAEHAKKGDRVHVQGELVMTNGEHKSTPKVLVRDFKFILRSVPSDDYKLNLAKLWQEFFSAPQEWWDNRLNKKNPRAPDFKHKGTQEALWLNSRDLPSWVPSQIEALESKGLLKRLEQ